MLIQELASALIDLRFDTALQILVDYFRKFGQIKHDNFTAILAQVTIKTSQGLQDRPIVFVSKDGLPKILRNWFEADGIPIIQATDAQDHAEVAAESFRLHPALQDRVLGGEIDWVDAAIGTNRICTYNPSCPGAFTKFIGDPDIVMHALDQGFICLPGGRVIVFSTREIEWDRGAFGGDEDLDVIEHVVAKDGISDDDVEEPAIEDPGD